MHETILTKELEKGILEVRLNRPERLNTLDNTLTGEVKQVVRELNRDSSTQVVILTGEGRGFCAGADMTTQSVPGDLPGT